MRKRFLILLSLPAFILFFSFIKPAAAVNIVQVTNPAETKNYIAGEDYVITWTQEPSKLRYGLRVEYLKADGTRNSEEIVSYSPPVSLQGGLVYSNPSLPMQNTMQYSWKIPITLYGDYKIKLYASYIDDNNLLQIAESYGPLIHIVQDAKISVTSPAAGVKIKAGDKYTISYTYWNRYPWPSTIGYYFNYNLYKGGSYYRSVYPGSSSNLSSVWQVPSDLPAGNDYQIQVEMAGVSAFSGYFMVESLQSSYAGSITSPLSSSIWQIGNNYSINWAPISKDAYPFVQLYLEVGKTADGKISLVPITPFKWTRASIQLNSIKTFNSGSFAWKIPASVDLSVVELGGAAYSYSLNLDPITYSLSVISQDAPLSGGKYILPAPIQIKNGSYRVYAILSDGASKEVRLFSNYFTINLPGTTPQTPVSVDYYKISDIKPGWLVKNVKYAEVFRVENDMTLRWIINEAVARRLYGTTWNKIIKEFSDLGAGGFKYGQNLE